MDHFGLPARRWNRGRRSGAPVLLPIEASYSWRVGTAESVSAGSVPPLAVRTQESDQSLPAGPSYLIGRDPTCDIVISDARVSWRHAVLRLEHGGWVLADNGSTNGIYAGYRRVDRMEISGECLIRLGHPADGPVLTCTVSGADAGTAAGGPRAGQPPPAAMLRIGRAPDNDVVVPDPGVSQYHAELRQEAGGYRLVDLDSRNGTFVNEQRVTAAMVSDGDLVGVGSATFRLVGHQLQEFVYPGVHGEETPPPAALSPAAGDGPLEIPYAVRWLVPRGERFANFDILNDNDTQLGYYRRFGPVYAVGIPTKKWRLVVVSDPELLDEVAGNEEQFGKPIEEINFFAQLQNTRGDGISVIGDGERYERIRRVMLPWYSPQSQRTQLPVMKEQAQQLVERWAELPDDEPLDARSWMERYTLEVSGRGACRYDFGLLTSGACPHAFAQAVPESTKESIARVAEPRPDLALSPGKRKKRKRYREQNRELFQAAEALVRARLHTAPLGEQTDLLSRLVSTPDPETGELLDA